MYLMLMYVNFRFCYWYVSYLSDLISFIWWLFRWKLYWYWGVIFIKRLNIGLGSVNECVGVELIWNLEICAELNLFELVDCSNTWISDFGIWVFVINLDWNRSGLTILMYLDNEDWLDMTEYFMLRFEYISDLEDGCIDDLEDQR